MQQFEIVKAVKSQKKARIALDGGPGSGKTYTALELAVGLAEGGKIGLLDTEKSSANMYADEFNFDTIKLTSFEPLTYAAALQAFAKAGYAVVIIDSLSHAWEGEGGALQQVEAAKKRHQGNSYVAWGDVTPMQNKMMAAILDYPGHVIATMRTKVEIILEKDERTGKTAPKKVGLKPIQREGVEFEFDVIADLDLEHNMLVSKTRLRFLDGKVINKPTRQVGLDILADLNSGAAVTDAAPTMYNEPEPGPFDSPAAHTPTRLESRQDDVDHAQYNGDGTPANAAAERYDAAPTFPEPEEVTDLASFLACMKALAITDPALIEKCKQRAGYAEADALDTLSMEALQNVYGTTRAAKIKKMEAAA